MIPGEYVVPVLFYVDRRIRELTVAEAVALDDPAWVVTTPAGLTKLATAGRTGPDGLAGRIRCPTGVDCVVASLNMSHAGR